MRYPRNARVFRGPVDGFLVGGVLFLLLIIVMLHSRLTFVAGVPIELTEGDDLPAVTNATVTVAIDARGLMFYQNQLIHEAELREGMLRAVESTQGPVTLVLLADRSVSLDLVWRLRLLARSVGIRSLVLAQRPSHPGQKP